jgi:hypothetical protein
MAQAKKKSAKKKTTRKAATKPKAKSKTAVVCEEQSLLDPSVIQAAAETLMSAVDAYRTEMSALDERGGMVTQAQIEIARFAAFAKGAMGDMEKIFGANVLRMRNGGEFEDGPLRVDFELQKGKRAPAWKDEAIRQARALANELGQVFNAEQFADGVLANTAPKDDKYKPVIRETTD